MKPSSAMETPPAASADAERHFASLLAFETDCWDVHASMADGDADFVLLDVRSPELFADGHVPGAVNLPHGRIVERNIAPYGEEANFVVYCAGPHCNGADKAALRLAGLERPVKKMIGGITGWLDEGFELVRSEDSNPAAIEEGWTMTDVAQPANESLRVRRIPERGRYDVDTIHAIVDEALVCHVGITTDEGPMVIPTLHARIVDRLLLHGSAASRLLRSARDQRICVTISLIDGLVLARTAFHHSANYRSVVVRGTPTEITELDEKAAALDVLTERLVPGRMADLRAHTEKEIRATTVLALPLTEASAKVREGGPNDDEEDYERELWAGVIPVETSFGDPITDPAMRMEVPVPGYVSDYRRPS